MNIQEHSPHHHNDHCNTSIDSEKMMISVLLSAKQNQRIIPLMVVADLQNVAEQVEADDDD